MHREARETLSRSTSAITGMTGPPRVSMHCVTACKCRGEGVPCGSATASATGWISAMAAGASAQRVSTIGNAPALLRMSSTSAAEVSATTTIGPSSAMTTSRFTGCVRHLRAWLLMPRQRNGRRPASSRRIRTLAKCAHQQWPAPRCRATPWRCGSLPVDRGSGSITARASRNLVSSDPGATRTPTNSRRARSLPDA